MPDAGHAALIETCLSDDDISAVALTTEEEGVALLARTCRFSLPMFVTMRG